MRSTFTVVFALAVEAKRLSKDMPHESFDVDEPQ